MSATVVRKTPRDNASTAPTCPEIVPDRMAAEPAHGWRAGVGRVSMVKEQWAGLDELRQRLPLLRATLSQVISERRRRGVTLYRKFVAEHQGHQGG